MAGPVAAELGLAVPPALLMVTQVEGLVEREGLLLVLLVGCGVIIVGEGVVECEAQVLYNAVTLVQIDALRVRCVVALVVAHGLLEVQAVALGRREEDAVKETLPQLV